MTVILWRLPYSCCKIWCQIFIVIFSYSQEKVKLKPYWIGSLFKVIYHGAWFYWWVRQNNYLLKFRTWLHIFIVDEITLKYQLLFDNVPGGGFAISDASDVSGLSGWMGDHLNSLKNLNQVLILFIVMLMTASITEVASNTACANVLIPILIQLVRNLRFFKKSFKIWNSNCFLDYSQKDWIFTHSTWHYLQRWHVLMPSCFRLPLHQMPL